MPAPRATIVIPTFNRASLVKRAIDTALAQTVPCSVIVSDHGSTDETPDVVGSYGNRLTYIRRSTDNGPFFSWLDGVVHAPTEFVHFSFDDDWIEPTFIEDCLQHFERDCAFVFSSVKIHHLDGAQPSLLYANMFETGVHPARKIERKLLGMTRTISPGCAVFRKSDLLAAITLRPPPGTRSTYHGAGPDLLMFLLPLLAYPKFGFVNKQLAHFLGHADSITINAQSNPEQERALTRAYDEAKLHFLRLKIARKLGLAEGLYGYERIRTALSNGRLLRRNLRKRVRQMLFLGNETKS